MAQSPPELKPGLTAFISGPLEVSSAYFERYYRPRIDYGIALNHAFVVGPVSGIDAIALEYLVSRAVPPSRIHIYMAGFEIASRQDFVRQMREELGEDVIVEARQSNGEEARTTWDRDAAMTRASDYDIIRFRTEWECKALYGSSWRPRVSNTERNERRRRGEPCQAYALEYICHTTTEEVKLKAEGHKQKFKHSGKTVDDVLHTVCDGDCDGHRDTDHQPLLLGDLPFGYGSDGHRLY